MLSLLILMFSANDQKIGGEMCWAMRQNFRIPSEEEMRRLVTPENVCIVFLVGNEL
jgi:transcription initiation factor TFIID subunit 1